MVSLKSQAIQTALRGDWENAIGLNQKILLTEPDDIDTLNRIACAYANNGNMQDAKTAYEKVLLLDAKNPIALRNMKRLNGIKGIKAFVPLNNLFLEEPGKTKIFELLNIADKKILSHLRAGEKIELCIKRNKIFALNNDKQYLGMLPDDSGQRLIKFMNGGNIYDAYVRTIDKNRLYIFVREIKRVKKFQDQSSFITNETKTKLSLKKGK